MWIAVILIGAYLPASAQQHIQGGLAAWPGIGIQATYLELRTVYSLETSVQMDYDPFVSRHTLHVGGSIGASLLPLNIWRTIGQADYGFDLDMGIRFGPRLVFVQNPTRADKNQQLGLFLDPFLRYRRYSTSMARYWFVEIGATRPILRIGIWFDV